MFEVGRRTKDQRREYKRGLLYIYFKAQSSNCSNALKLSPQGQKRSILAPALDNLQVQTRVPPNIHLGICHTEAKQCNNCSKRIRLELS